ncbi:hypothetical protein NFI96_009631, partial [Prochilodus magdalenae]
GQVDITCLDGQKVVQAGENISLTCSTSSSYIRAIAWFKETLLIASAFSSTPQYHNDFEKSGRFIALKEQSSLTLIISNAEPSDSATYYCSVTEYTDVALLGCTVFVLKGSPSRLSAVLQHPVSDPVELGGDTTLQCSVLTDTSAGEHSVYWFRHGSGESHPGIIYTHGNRSDQCKSSSETDSSTQSCVYKLPKRNLSLSDAGTYYCAVLMCGEIIFGSGTKLDFVEEGALVPAVLGLAAFSIISIAVVLFLCRKLHSSHSKDELNLAEQSCPVESLKKRNNHLTGVPIYGTKTSETSCSHTTFLSPPQDLRLEQIGNIQIGKGGSTIQKDQVSLTINKLTGPVTVDGISRDTTPLLQKSAASKLHAPPAAVMTLLRATERHLAHNPYLASNYLKEILKPEKSGRLSSLSAEYDHTVNLIYAGDHLSKADGLPEETLLPIVLAPELPITQLLVRDYDERLLHPGPDSFAEHKKILYWILRGRQAIRKTLMALRGVSQVARHGSGESHPGIIYTHGNRSDQCKSSSEADSSTQSCVYKLPKRNLSLSDAGTYYCAVLMCGEIILGSGTKLDVVGNDEPITVSTSSVKPTYTLALYGRMLLPFDQYMADDNL